MSRILILCIIFMLAGLASLQAEDIMELKDGRTMRGEVVEEGDDQVRIRVRIGGGGEAVLGFTRDRITRLVVGGEGRDLGPAAPTPAEIEEEPEAAAEEEPEPEPEPMPLLGESRFWQRLQAGEAQELVVYGTSLVTQRHTRMPTRLREAFAEALDDGSIVTVTEVTNAGEYSKWGANNVSGQVARRKPGAVIMEFASNDSVDRFNQSVEEARKNWARIVTTLQKESPETDIFLYVTAPPWDRSDSGRGAHAMRREGFENYFQMVREVAVEHQVYLIDTYHEFLAVKDPPDHRQYRQYLGDGHHPSGRGVSEIILPMMFQAFKHGSTDTLGKPGIHRLQIAKPNKE